MAVLSASDIIYALIHCLVEGNKEPKIHINAHIAGALSGILLGFACYGNYRHKKTHFKIAWWLSMICYASFVVAVIIINLARN